MKALVVCIFFLLASSVAVGKTYVPPEPENSGAMPAADAETDARIRGKFVEIDRLFASIDSKFKQIYDLRGNIDVLIENKLEGVACNALNQLKSEKDKINEKISELKTDIDIKAYEDRLNDITIAYLEQDNFIKSKKINCSTYK